MEKRYIRKDGQTVWVELTVSIVRPAGQSPYFISVIKDINERKKTDEELLQARRNLQQRVQQRTVELVLEIRESELAQQERDSFFELAPDIMVITAINGFFRRVNPALCQLLDYSATHLLANPIDDILYPEDRERTRTFREALLHGEKNQFDVFENRLIARDGSVKWVSWSGRTLLGFNYLTGRDITELKAAEDAARRRQAELASHSKLQAIGLMAANMAHEINNPLTIIYGEGLLLRKMLEQGVSDSDKFRRMADNVVKMSERLNGIVNGLRTLARDGSMDPMEVVTLRQIIDATVPFCRGEIQSRKIAFNVHMPKEDVFVCGRPVQLSQVLLNLLNNASDALSARHVGAEIAISTRFTESRVEILVHDNGPGVPPAIRERLFQPFVSSKEAGRGMGLGLSISRSMIVDNGGDLFLQEDPSGTTFVISLPRVDAE
jgi:PAS domain S-box-containing protein